MIEYKAVSKLVDEWLINHSGETFDLDLICRQLNVIERETRHFVVQKLSNEVRAEKLEKSNRIYKVLTNNIRYIDWVNSSDKDEIEIKWPFSHSDGSKFGFDGHIKVRPADLIVVAGVSNKGKSTFCRNFLWENMDTYASRMMVNEYAPGRFKSVVSRMDWNTALREDGQPKFELIERREDWKYAIEPDSINIVDWINLTDNFYKINVIMEDIQQKLRGGIALVVLQKSEFKEQGRGGQFSEDFASVYFVIDTNRLTVRKAKEWRGINPNGQVYGFSIVDYGAQFSNIRPIKICPHCNGKGQAYSKGGGYAECDVCFGTGWVDKE